MKKSILSLTFLAMLATSLFSAEIEGFRDFKWGVSPTSLSGKVLIEESRDDREKIVSYKLQNENVYIGNVDVDGILYNFYNNKLYNVFIYYHGTSYFISLKDTFVAKYGKGKKEDILGYEYSWSSPKGYISIGYDPIKETGSIYMIGNKLFNQSVKYKEQLAKQSAKDI